MLMAVTSIGSADPIADREWQDIAREIAGIRSLMAEHGVRSQQGGALDQLTNAKGDNATEIRSELEQIRRLMAVHGVGSTEDGALAKLANAKGGSTTEILRELEQIRRQLQGLPPPEGNMRAHGGGMGGSFKNKNNSKK
jgi:hypothetical protein